MNHDLRNLVYGGLVGDALGIQFEFFQKHMCNVDDLEYRESHFLPIKAGCWSDDGDSMLLILKQMKESKEDKVNHLVYAKNKKEWVDHGIPELGQKTGVGCGNTVLRVTTTPCFLDDPHTASKTMYDKYHSEANGALMAISILGLSSKDENIVIENILNISKVTHYGNLSQMACLIAGLLVYRINQTVVNIYDCCALNKLIYMIISRAIKIVRPTAEEIRKLAEIIKISSIEELVLDEEFKMGYCLKTLGCVLWALKNINFGFEKILKEIYKQGGDTDTNGCVVGSVIGSIIGVPDKWINGLIYKKYVDDLLAL